MSREQTEHIDGLFFSPVFDLRVGESQHEVEVILQVIQDYKITKFVEIGVHEGGLTEFILNKTLCQYLGIEIDQNIVSQEIKTLVSNHGDKILYTNCMGAPAYTEIRSFTQNGRCLVYCDNGNKPMEIERYHTVIRPGSILLTHDFTDGTRNIRELPYYYFDTREVTEQDIAFIESDDSFERLPEMLFAETRNIGWIKK